MKTLEATRGILQRAKKSPLICRLANHLIKFKYQLLSVVLISLFAFFTVAQIFASVSMHLYRNMIAIRDTLLEPFQLTVHRLRNPPKPVKRHGDSSNKLTSKETVVGDVKVFMRIPPLLTPNMFLRSGSLNRKGMFDTCSLLGVLSLRGCCCCCCCGGCCCCCTTTVCCSCDTSTADGFCDAALTCTGTDVGE